MVNMRTKEEIVDIIDDFIKYKDYFENPPKEAYLVDDWDYSECKEAKKIEQLLYKHDVFDTKYYSKIEVMGRKYHKSEALDFSREKLSLEEVFAVLTWLHRYECHSGGCFLRAIENRTFYNLICRLEEIKMNL